MSQVNFEEQVWDLKKIIIGVVSLSAVAGGVYYAKTHYLDKKTVPPSPTQVEGTSTTTDFNPSPTPIRINLGEKVAELKNEVSHLSVSEISSSSPQVQQILNQVKGLQDLPKDEAKVVCQKICGGL